LQVDEGTIRRDLKFLQTPEDQRPVKETRQKKINLLSPEQRFKQVMKIGKKWFLDQELSHYAGLWVISEAGRRLHFGRQNYRHLPEPILSPAELLPSAEPERQEFPDQPGADIEKQEHCTAWFARWQALNYPRDEKTQDKVLRDLQDWVQGELW
jgi:hypothetical protein